MVWSNIHFDLIYIHNLTNKKNCLLFDLFVHMVVWSKSRTMFEYGCVLVLHLNVVRSNLQQTVVREDARKKYMMLHNMIHTEDASIATTFRGECRRNVELRGKFRIDHQIHGQVVAW